MVRSWVVGVAVAATVAACGPNTAAYDASYTRQATEIDERYDALRAEETDRWAILLRQVDAQRQYLVAVKPGAGYAPAERIDVTLGDVRKACADAHASAAAETGDLAAQLGAFADDCDARVLRDIYVPQLVAKYFKADARWALQTWVDGGAAADLEALFAFSHNTRLLADLADLRETVREQRDRALASLAAMHSQEITTAGVERDRAVEAEEQRYRQRLAAVSAALGALGQTLSQPSPAPASSFALAPSGAPSTSASCSSDYSCGVGAQCVKPRYSATGVCAKTVNEYGNATFDLPRAASVMPKMPASTDCKLPLDCPIGFTCDASSGVCLR
jgi:hypothetical protein